MKCRVYDNVEHFPIPKFRLIMRKTVNFLLFSNNYLLLISYIIHVYMYVEKHISIVSNLVAWTMFFKVYFYLYRTIDMSVYVPEIVFSVQLYTVIFFCGNIFKPSFVKLIHAFLVMASFNSNFRINSISFSIHCAFGFCLRQRHLYINW